MNSVSDTNNNAGPVETAAVDTTTTKQAAKPKAMRICEPRNEIAASSRARQVAKDAFSFVSPF